MRRSRRPLRHQLPVDALEQVPQLQWRLVVLPGSRVLNFATYVVPLAHSLDVLRLLVLLSGQYAPRLGGGALEQLRGGPFRPAHARKSAG
ncbi:hypothetical protein D9M73_297550 [compost metagenome]